MHVCVYIYLRSFTLRDTIVVVRLCVHMYKSGFDYAKLSERYREEKKEQAQ